MLDSATVHVVIGTLVTRGTRIVHCVVGSITAAFRASNRTLLYTTPTANSTRDAFVHTLQAAYRSKLLHSLCMQMRFGLVCPGTLEFTGVQCILCERDLIRMRECMTATCESPTTYNNQLYFYQLNGSQT